MATTHGQRASRAFWQVWFPHPRRPDPAETGSAHAGQRRPDQALWPGEAPGSATAHGRRRNRGSLRPGGRPGPGGPTAQRSCRLPGTPGVAKGWRCRTAWTGVASCAAAQSREPAGLPAHSRPLQAGRGAACPCRKVPTGRGRSASAPSEHPRCRACGRPSARPTPHPQTQRPPAGEVAGPHNSESPAAPTGGRLLPVSKEIPPRQGSACPPHPWLNAADTERRAIGWDAKVQPPSPNVVPSCRGRRPGSILPGPAPPPRPLSCTDSRGAQGLRPLPPLPGTQSLPWPVLLLPQPLTRLPSPCSDSGWPCLEQQTSTPMQSSLFLKRLALPAHEGTTLWKWTGGRWLRTCHVTLLSPPGAEAHPPRREHTR